MHNAVVRPHSGGLNPYHIGFYIFNKIEKLHGLEKCFEIREVHDDVSAVRLYLEEDDFRELNLFNYERKKNGDVFISEVSDHDDWKSVRDEMIRNTGINTIPHIYVDRVEKDNTLVLKHEHDGRDIDLNHANEVIKSIKSIWKNNVKFYTIIEDEMWEI
jgi:stage V sporulation protein R